MSYDRFQRYVFTSLGCGYFMHMVITVFIAELLLGIKDASEHFYPFAGPIFIFGAYLGYQLVRDAERREKLEQDEDAPGD